MCMKLFEILEEGVALDFVELYHTYGAWIHPSKPEPVYVADKHGHAASARKILGQNIDPQESEHSIYKTMFNNGWVRTVHQNMRTFSVSGTSQAIKRLLPTLAGLRDDVREFYLDVEDCSGSRCNTIKADFFTMPKEWRDFRNAIQ